MEKLVPIKPRTMAEMLPEIGCLLSKDAMQNLTLTATKKARPTIANTRTNEKAIKPMTLAQMRDQIKSLQINSPKPKVQATASAKRKWNSSCKLENKTVSHTAHGQMKHNSVRKVLTFLPPKPVAPKSLASSRINMLSSETPKFPKPEIKAKKSLQLQGRSAVRISGICNIPETPAIIKSQIIANKENIPSAKDAIFNKLIATPKSTLRKKVLASRIPQTPLSNDSWTSGEDGDASFLRNEVAMEHIESETKALEAQTLNNIDEVLPPVSTPFTEYRSVTGFFNNSSDTIEDTNDNTIMCFNNTASKETYQREESVIVSLCDMLNKATMSAQDTTDTDLLEVQKQTENNIKEIEKCIQAFSNMKEQLQFQNKTIQKMIKDRQQTSKCSKDKTVLEIETMTKSDKELTHAKVNIEHPVIKTILRSPLYKIPKKSPCMKKKVFHKSMPNIPAPMTPLKNMGEKALSVYMKIKQQNSYLVTPVSKPRPMQVPDTNTKTSHNLQKQLDKLYEEH